MVAREPDLFAEAPKTRRERFADHAKKAHKSAARERFEREFAFQCQLLKLPAPLEQYPFAESLGRKFRADFAWPVYSVLVEIQGGIWRRGGGAHSHPTNIERDVEKQQLAALLGWFVCPVTTDEVKAGTAVDIVQRVLAARGWKR